jgi:hypothetical protein
MCWRVAIGPGLAGNFTYCQITGHLSISGCRVQLREEEKAAARRINKVALDSVVYAPLGQYLQYQAWHKKVSGVPQGPLPFFWRVTA